MQTTILLLKVNPRPAEKCHIFLLEGMARQLKQLLDILLTAGILLRVLTLRADGVPKELRLLSSLCCSCKQSSPLPIGKQIAVRHMTSNALKAAMASTAEIVQPKL